MKKNHISRGEVTGYSVSVMTEDGGLEVLRLTIHIENATYEYRVCCDGNNPDLRSIHHFISEAFNTTLGSPSRKLIKENSERDYIYVFHNNTEYRKYTAQRLAPK